MESCIFLTYFVHFDDSLAHEVLGPKPAVPRRSRLGRDLVLDHPQRNPSDASILECLVPHSGLRYLAPPTSRENQALRTFTSRRESLLNMSLLRIQSPELLAALGCKALWLDPAGRAATWPVPPAEQCRPREARLLATVPGPSPSWPGQGLYFCNGP